jgi:hypothetical protein
MAKRIVAGGMWLMLIAWAWNYLALLTGVPGQVGLLIGAGVAAFVATDPLGLFFARPASSRPARGVASLDESFTPAE